MGAAIGAIVGFSLSFTSLSPVLLGGVIGFSLVALLVIHDIYKGTLAKKEAAFLTVLGTSIGLGLGAAAGFVSSGLSTTLAGRCFDVSFNTRSLVCC